MPSIWPNYSPHSRPICAISRRSFRLNSARSAPVDFPWGPPLRIIGAIAWRFRGRNGLCLIFNMLYLDNVFSPRLGIAQN